MKRRFSTFSTIQSFVKVENFVFRSFRRLVFRLSRSFFTKKRPLTLASGTPVPFPAFCGLKPPCDLLHAPPLVRAGRAWIIVRVLGVRNMMRVRASSLSCPACGPRSCRPSIRRIAMLGRGDLTRQRLRFLLFRFPCSHFICSCEFSLTVR